MIFQLLLLWIMCVTCNAQSCGRGCTHCRMGNDCAKCRNGYFLSWKDEHYRCNECPDNCATCNGLNFANEPVNCQSCEDGYYLHLQNNKDKCSECPANCKTCKSLTYKPENVQCETCLDGFYLKLLSNKYACVQCQQGCKSCYSDAHCSTCNHDYYLSDIKCEECPSGRWGQECKLSCIPCSECVSDICTRDCVIKVGTAYCQHQHSTCHNECSKGFIGQRRSDVSTTITVPTTIGHQSTERIITQLTTTLRQQKTTRTTIIITEPPQTPTSYITPSIPEDATTLQTEAQTNGSGSTVLYIVIAVLAGLVLSGVIVALIIGVKWRKQICRRDQESSPHNPNNEAESRQLTDSTGVHFNVSNQNNVIGNVATINVDESDTGYVDMTTVDNIATINAAGSTTGNVDLNTIDTIATINIAGSNTEYVDLNATAYVNVVDKPVVNTTDTVNTYEALSQYTNVRDAENQYTSLSGNENVYYSVPD